jgi:23S rRNA (cytosine1962-C5)-methyltransferase
VVHVDAATNIVRWAQRNFAASGPMAGAVRWLAEDARKFVARELRRGNQYQAVILDPPTYGHGPKGEPWQLDKHLPQLLADCFRLTRENCAFVLLTCHAAHFDLRRLRSLMRDAADGRRGQLRVCQLDLATADGRCLPSGLAARWAE